MGDLVRPRHAMPACTGAARLHARPGARARGHGLVPCGDAVERASAKFRQVGPRRHRTSRRRAQRSRLPLRAKRRPCSSADAARTRASHAVCAGRRIRPRDSKLLDLRANPPAIPPRTTLARLTRSVRNAVHRASRPTVCLAHCAFSIGISSRALCIHQSTRVARPCRVLIFWSLAKFGFFPSSSSARSCRALHSPVLAVAAYST